MSNIFIKDKKAYLNFILDMLNNFYQLNLIIRLINIVFLIFKF